MHESDVDYTSQHLLSDDALEEMIESTLSLAHTLSPTPYSRGRAPTPRESSWRAPLRPVERPVVPYDPAVLTEVLAKQAEQPRTVTEGDASVIQDEIKQIGNATVMLRTLAVDDPVFGHALNSIDLGLVGLARVVGGSVEEGNQP